ncbi:MAG: beta-ketoacyl-ACP synthase III [Pseudomonadales bacterium]|nr:beta-ketoacyl-ACP synthase III [Pseudomonadales bacterium]
MSNANFPRIVISGTGLYTPNESISNAELVETFNAYVDKFNGTNKDAIDKGEIEPLQYSSVEFIEKASGIKSRFVMNKTGVLDPDNMKPSIAERSDEEPSIQCDMAVAAIKQALANANKTPDDVDAVLVACSNMQRPYPAMAIEVQSALGIKGYGYDMNVACSSATFGIQAGKDAILSGSADCVVVVNPEICSAHLAWEDRDCHFIFGDVCTAIVLERQDTATVDHPWEIMGSRLQTQFSNNIRNNFGFLNRCDENGVGARDKLFRQNGRKVFKEVVPLVSELITSHLSDTGIEIGDLKRMWLHQANLSMNLLISKKVLGREASIEEAPVILDQYANTSSAGSIIAFHKYCDDFAAGDVGVICSFGAGYSAGSVIVKRL